MSTAHLARHVAILKAIWSNRDIRRFILTVAGVYCGLAAWSLTFRPIDRLKDAIPYVAEPCGYASNPCVVEVTRR